VKKLKFEFACLFHVDINKGCGGGLGEVAFSTLDSSCGPFHYFDPNRLTKRISLTGNNHTAFCSPISINYG